MFKKKIFSSLLALTLGAALLAGCSSGSSTSSSSMSGSGSKTEGSSQAATKSSDGDVQVGIVLPTKDEPRWIQDQTQFEKILGDAGFTNQVLFSQGSSATEKTNVESLLSKKMKVLIICADDASAAAATIDEAKKAGVKVIAYDRLITGTDAVDYYVTFDSLAVGAAQGQYLIDNAPSGKKGVPLYLYAGKATDNNAFIFFQGAWNVLQPKIADGTFVIANSSEATALKDKKELTRDDIGKIIGQITTDWDFNVAKSKAEANLTSAKAEMKGDVLVLAPNDGTSRSIADVFATDKDVKSYKVTGQDAEKASVQYVIDGKQSMTVFKDTRQLAKDAVEMATALLKDETPKTDTTYNNEKKDVPAKQTPIVVVTKDSVQKDLIDSGYYEASEFTGLK